MTDPGARTRLYSEDDEDIRKAKAYALAIQNNPNMTTDEIKQLLANEKQSQIVEKAAHQKIKDQEQQNNNVLAGFAAAFQQNKGGGNNSDNQEQNNSDEINGSGETSRGNDPTMSPKHPVSPTEQPKNADKHRPLSPMRPFVNTKAVSNPKPPPALPVNTASGDTSSPTNSKSNQGSGVGGGVSGTNNNTKTGTSGDNATGTGASGNSGGGMTNKDGPSTTTPGQQQQQQQNQKPKWTTTICESDHIGNDTIRLAAVLWKRRSGLGKLSVKHGWERRRVVLAGNRIMYYKSGSDDNDDNDEEPLVEDDDAPDPSGGGGMAKHRASIFNMIEQTKGQYEKKLNALTKEKKEKEELPRGILDLIQENATVAASKGHSGAPTPFAISIKVRGETKWKFCFDSRPLQMEWLAALSDVVVISSVDAYNRALVEASDPNFAEHMAHGTFFDTPMPSEPIATTDNNDPKATGNTAGGTAGGGTGHRLWMVEEYKLQSEHYNDEEQHDQLAFEDDSCDEDEYGEFTYEEDELAFKTFKHPSTSSTSAVPLILTNYNLWEIRGNNLFHMALIVNSSLFYAHSYATTTNFDDKFWYLVACTNLALWLLLSEYKEEEVREVKDGGLVAMKKRASNNKRQKLKLQLSKGVLTKGGSNEAVANKQLAASTGKMEAATGGGYVPVAGTTTIQLDDPQGSPWKGDQYFGAWCAPSGETLMVRSHGYLKTKVKVPSPGEMYNLVNVDIFESPSRYPDMAKKVKLPKVDFGDETGMVKTWHAPDIFIISIALPTDPPKLGVTSNDGSGYTITMYLTMKEETREILKRVTADGYDPSQEPAGDVQKSKVNAVKLLNEWCRRAPDDPKFQSRFKLVPNAHNLKEIGMPNWIAKYNGKPVLIKRPGQTGFTFPHPELNVFEFDISLHPFPYLAKQGICYMKQNFFKQVLVTFGFCIEGRADDELPECIIGLMQLCYPDPQYAIQAEDFFKGTSPRSF